MVRRLSAQSADRKTWYLMATWGLPMQKAQKPLSLALCVAISVCQFCNGCFTPMLHDQLPAATQSDIPRELDKMTYPQYRVEPPDILLIEAVHNIRPPEDPLRAGDELLIRVANTLPIDPTEDPLAGEFKIINNIYQIQADGTVDLGPEYRSVSVAGLTVDEAQTAIERHLREVVELEMPQVAVSMPDVSGKQVITGEHLVRPDGTVQLGVYGSVFVSGLTLLEIKATIEAHLSQFIHRPEVNVDVIAYNSKVFYIISDGGGFGESVIRLPCTGNETVLDAIAQVEGLSDVSSKEMWVARPGPPSLARSQILKVDWRAITQDGVTTTNYQLFPGDRLYVQADHLVALDNFISKVTSPAERIFGFILLGHGVVRSLQFGDDPTSGGFGGFGGGF